MIGGSRMTALEIAMAGCLAFGQPTGNYYEAITTHSGLQVIHSKENSACPQMHSSRFVVSMTS